MGFELEVDNYRALRRVRWKADGVCALVGPNGSGKTTLLSVLPFLGSAAIGGFGQALNENGGTLLFRHRDASYKEPVRFAVTVREARWESEPATSGPGVVIPVPQRLLIAGEVMAEQKAGESVYYSFGDTFDSEDSLLKGAVELGLDPDDEASVLGLALITSVLYNFENFWTLKKEGSRGGTETRLSPNGRNAFTVLRNWIAGKKPHRARWEWVRRGLKECFPELFDDLDFEVAGQTVAAQFYGPKGGEPTPMHLAPNGLLMALLILCAVASAGENEIVCIDEPENGLHPYAIQRLIALLRERAESHGLTIVLATHSPTLLNEFNDQPDHVFIMEPWQETLPVRLDQHQNPEWLRNFALGDLYMNQTIGPQVKPSP